MRVFSTLFVMVIAVHVGLATATQVKMELFRGDYSPSHACTRGAKPDIVTRIFDEDACDWVSDADPRGYMKFNCNSDGTLVQAKLYEEGFDGDQTCPRDPILDREFTAGECAYFKSGDTVRFTCIGVDPEPSSASSTMLNNHTLFATIVFMAACFSTMMA